MIIYAVNRINHPAYGYYFHGTILMTIKLNHGSRDRNSLIFTEVNYLCSESKQYSVGCHLFQRMLFEITNHGFGARNSPILTEQQCGWCQSKHSSVNLHLFRRMFVDISTHGFPIRNTLKFLKMITCAGLQANFCHIHMYTRNVRHCNKPQVSGSNFTNSSWKFLLVLQTSGKVTLISRNARQDSKPQVSGLNLFTHVGLGYQNPALPVLT